MQFECEEFADCPKPTVTLENDENYDAKRVDEFDPINVIFENSPSSLPASLRRTMMSDIPTWVIDKIILVEYTGDENWLHVVHRIEQSIIRRTEGIDDVVNIGARQQMVADITAHDASSTNLLVVHSHTMFDKHQDLEVVDTGMVVCRLSKGQRLKFTAFLTYQCGSVHPKWTPSSAECVRVKPTIKIRKLPKSMDLKTKSKIIGNLIASCPSEVFVRGTTQNVEDISVMAYRCTLCRQCEKEMSKVLDISITVDDENDSCLHVESKGSIPTFEIIKTSFERLQSRLSEITVLNTE